MYQFQLLRLSEINPLYNAFPSTEKALQKLKMFKENKKTVEIIVYPTEKGDFLLAEGYDLYFTLRMLNGDTDVFCKLGDYNSELEVRYAVLRELLSNHNSRWSIKMDLFSTLMNQFNQEITVIAKTLGMQIGKVSNYIIHDDISSQVRVKACKYESGRLANKIARSRLETRYKLILYEFVTYPKKDPLRLSDQTWQIASQLIQSNKEFLTLLSDKDVRHLIIDFALKYKQVLQNSFEHEALILISSTNKYDQ
jgi:hypothetical protein